MLIEAASRVNGYGFNVPELSLDPAFDQHLLETLVLEGHPIAGVEWYPEDYFDRLMALERLTISNGSRMPSGNTKVSKDFFSHIAPLRGVTWHGIYLTNSHQKAFTMPHGGTFQFLDLSIRMKHL